MAIHLYCQLWLVHNFMRASTQIDEFGLRNLFTNCLQMFAIFVVSCYLLQAEALAAGVNRAHSLTNSHIAEWQNEEWIIGYAHHNYQCKQCVQSNYHRLMWFLSPCLWGIGWQIARRISVPQSFPSHISCHYPVFLPSPSPPPSHIPCFWYATSHTTGPINTVITLKQNEDFVIPFSVRDTWPRCMRGANIGGL